MMVTNGVWINTLNCLHGIEYELDFQNFLKFFRNDTKTNLSEFLICHPSWLNIKSKPFRALCCFSCYSLAFVRSLSPDFFLVTQSRHHHKFFNSTELVFLTLNFMINSSENKLCSIY